MVEEPLQTAPLRCAGHARHALTHFHVVNSRIPLWSHVAFHRRRARTCRQGLDEPRSQVLRFRALCLLLVHFQQSSRSFQRYFVPFGVPTDTTKLAPEDMYPAASYSSSSDGGVQSQVILHGEFDTFESLKTAVAAACSCKLSMNCRVQPQERVVRWLQESLPDLDKYHTCGTLYCFHPFTAANKQSWARTSCSLCVKYQITHALKYRITFINLNHNHRRDVAASAVSAPPPSRLEGREVMIPPSPAERRLFLSQVFVAALTSTITSETLTRDLHALLLQHHVSCIHSQTQLMGPPTASKQVVSDADVDADGTAAKGSAQAIADPAAAAPAPAAIAPAIPASALLPALLVGVPAPLEVTPAFGYTCDVLNAAKIVTPNHVQAAPVPPALVAESEQAAEMVTGTAVFSGSVAASTRSKKRATVPLSPAVAAASEQASVMDNATAVDAGSVAAGTQSRKRPAPAQYANPHGSDLCDQPKSRAISGSCDAPIDVEVDLPAPQTDFTIFHMQAIKDSSRVIIECGEDGNCFYHCMLFLARRFQPSLCTSTAWDSHLTLRQAVCEHLQHNWQYILCPLDTSDSTLPIIQLLIGKTRNPNRPQAKIVSTFVSAHKKLGQYVENEMICAFAHFVKQPVVVTHLAYPDLHVVGPCGPMQRSHPGVSKTPFHLWCNGGHYQAIVCMDHRQPLPPPPPIQ